MSNQSRSSHLGVLPRVLPGAKERTVEVLILEKIMVGDIDGALLGLSEGALDGTVNE